MVNRLVIAATACVYIIGLCSCSSRLVTVHVPSTAVAGTKPTAEGIFYALPRTVVNVDAPVQLTESKPGKYVEFAPIFFADEKAVKAKAKKLQLMAAKFTTAGEPDPKAIYYVAVAGSAAVDWSRTFQLNEDGTIATAKEQADNQTTDIALGVLSSAASIAGKLIAPGAALTASCIAGSAEEAVACYLEQVGHGYGERFRDLKVSDSAAYNKIVSKENVQQNQGRFSIIDPSPLTSAVDSLGTIDALRKRRYDMFTAPTGGVTLSEAVFTRLDALIAERVRDFLGSETTNTWHAIFDVRPERISDVIVLFKLNAKEGLCVVADLGDKTEPPENFRYDFGAPKAADTPVYCQAGGSGLDPVKVSFALAGADQMLSRVASNFKTVDDEDTKPFEEEHSFRYRIPAVVTATLATSAAGSANSKSRLLVAQFGTLVALPASPGGKSAMYSLKYFAATGALQNFDLSTKAVLTKGTVDTLGSSAAAIVDARNKEAAQKKKEADQLNQLDRQRAILEDQVKIQQACQTLNIDCTTK